MKWPPDMIERARQLWEAGHSASEIAADLGHGLSRNAVTGKLHRLGIVRGHSNNRSEATSLRLKIRRRREKPPAPAPVVMRKRLARTPASPKVFHYILEFDQRPMRELSPDDIPLAQRKQLLDLRANDCRWPYGDPGKPGFFFCGGETIVGHSYCATHHAISRGRAVTISDAERERRRALGLRQSTRFNDKRRAASP